MKQPTPVNYSAQEMQTLEKNKDRANLMVRRQALQVIGAGVAAAGGLLVLQGCNRSGSQSSGPGGAGSGSGASSGSCKDKVEVDETAQQLRKTLQYKEKSDTPGKKCNICAQFEAARFTALGCGGCKLFGGAVNPEGVCLSFAPLQAPPAAGAPPPPAAPAAPAG